MGSQGLLRIMRLEGTKLRIAIKMGFPTMFSGVRMMSSNVFMCLEDASLLFSCKCRPFGSAAILGGYDRDGPQLYMIEPSGVAYVCSHLQPSLMMLMLSPLFLVLDMGKCGLRSSFFWSLYLFLWQWHTVCDSNLSGIMKYIRVISAAGSDMINAHICHPPLKFLYF